MVGYIAGMDAIEAKFWDRINKTETCWFWTGHLTPKGHPIFHISKKPLVRKMAHHYSYELHYGSLDDKLVRIEHSCGNLSCVNPVHLICGEEMRFWSNVDKTSENGCWNWTGFIRSNEGNGYFSLREPIRTSMLAHRYSYERLVRPLTEDEVLVHTCSNQLCVNPKHLSVKPRARDVNERFWSKVQKLSEANGGCWIWCGTIDYTTGYGNFFIQDEGDKKITVSPHRYSWELYVGHKLPSPHIMVCHKCDIKVCVNPDHLFIGEAIDNAQDCKNKRRNAYGIKHGRAKINPVIVMEIRSSPLSTKELSEKFGIHRSQVIRVRKGESWQSVPLAVAE